MYQFHFHIPPYYTLLVRSLSVLEVRRGGGTGWWLGCVVVLKGVVWPFVYKATGHAPVLRSRLPLPALPTNIVSPLPLTSGHCPGQRPQLQGAGGSLPLDCAPTAHRHHARAAQVRGTDWCGVQRVGGGWVGMVVHGTCVAACRCVAAGPQPHPAALQPAGSFRKRHVPAR